MNLPATPLLTAADEQRLARERAAAAAHGDARAARAARDALIVANIGLVFHVAKRYPQLVPFEDLVQEGMLGLMKAAETFDTRGVRFSTHAGEWIRSAISNLLTNHGRLIRVPAHLVVLDMKARKIAKRLGRNATVEAVAQAIGEPAHRVRAAGAALSVRAVPIDAPVRVRVDTTIERDRTIADLLVDHAPGADEHLDAAVRRAALRHALARLPEREHQILVNHFGLGREAISLEAIGAQHGVSRENVRLAQVRALKRLRAMLASDGVT